MTAPLISCIVPVFNGETYLREALDSILAQTYRPIEIVVADDGSTDETAAIAASYGEAVRYIHQPNAGAPAARNLGLRHATGELIAFLDADDLWHPEKLTRQMEMFEAQPDLDVCVTHLQAFWIPALAHEAELFRGHRLSQPLPGYVTVTMLARRTMFDPGRVGPFETSLSVGDPLDWFLRAGECGAKTALHPDTLVSRRMHTSNLSWEAGVRVMSREMETSLVKVVKASLDRRRRSSKEPTPLNFPTG